MLAVYMCRKINPNCPVLPRFFEPSPDVIGTVIERSILNFMRSSMSIETPPPRSGFDGRSTFLGLCISRFIHPALSGRSSFVHFYFKRSSPKHSRLFAKVRKIYFVLRSTQCVECTFVIFCSPIYGRKDLCYRVE